MQTIEIEEVDHTVEICKFEKRRAELVEVCKPIHDALSAAEDFSEYTLSLRYKRPPRRLEAGDEEERAAERRRLAAEGGCGAGGGGGLGGSRFDAARSAGKVEAVSLVPWLMTGAQSAAVAEAEAEAEEAAAVSVAQSVTIAPADESRKRKWEEQFLKELQRAPFLRGGECGVTGGGGEGGGGGGLWGSLEGGSRGSGRGGGRGGGSGGGGGNDEGCDEDADGFGGIDGGGRGGGGLVTLRMPGVSAAERDVMEEVGGHHGGEDWYESEEGGEESEEEAMVEVEGVLKPLSDVTEDDQVSNALPMFPIYHVPCFMYISPDPFFVVHRRA